MTEENFVEKVRIYEAKWSRYSEEDRIYSHSAGLYLNCEDAKRALLEIKHGEKSFYSMEIIPRGYIAVKIGQKVYSMIEYSKEFLKLSEKLFKEVQGVSKPKELTNPLDLSSDLENLAQDLIHVDLGERVMLITTKPLEVK